MSEQAKELIAQKIKQAEQLIEECKVIAEENKVPFVFNLGAASNVDRRIAGDYYPKGASVEIYEAEGRQAEWGDSPDIYEEDSWKGCGEECTIEECGERCGTKVLKEGIWSAWTSSGEMC